MFIVLVLHRFLQRRVKPLKVRHSPFIRLPGSFAIAYSQMHIRPSHVLRAQVMVPRHLVVLFAIGRRTSF